MLDLIVIRVPSFCSAFLETSGAPESLLRISCPPDQTGTPVERCALNSSADHTNHRRNPSFGSMCWSHFSLFAECDLLKAFCDREYLKKLWVASVSFLFQEVLPDNSTVLGTAYCI